MCSRKHRKQQHKRPTKPNWKLQEVGHIPKTEFQCPQFLLLCGCQCLCTNSKKLFHLHWLLSFSQFSQLGCLASPFRRQHSAHFSCLSVWDTQWSVLQKENWFRIRRYQCRQSEAAVRTNQSIQFKERDQLKKRSCHKLLSVLDLSSLWLPRKATLETASLMISVMPDPAPILPLTGHEIQFVSWYRYASRTQSYLHLNFERTLWRYFSRRHAGPARCSTSLWQILTAVRCKGRNLSSVFVAHTHTGCKHLRHLQLSHLCQQGLSGLSKDLGLGRRRQWNQKQAEWSHQLLSAKARLGVQSQKFHSVLRGIFGNCPTLGHRNRTECIHVQLSAPERQVKFSQKSKIAKKFWKRRATDECGAKLPWPRSWVLSEIWLWWSFF